MNQKHCLLLMIHREKLPFLKIDLIQLEILGGFHTSLAVQLSWMKTHRLSVLLGVFHMNLVLLMKSQMKIVLQLVLLEVYRMSPVMKMMNLEMRHYLMIL